MKREEITINKYVLSHIINEPYDEDKVEVDENEVAKYKMVQRTIDSLDESDGGADYTVIIERLEDHKFFELKYQEWDINWEYRNFESDFPEELIEVFPKKVESVIYE